MESDARLVPTAFRASAFKLAASGCAPCACSGTEQIAKMTISSLFINPPQSPCCCFSANGIFLLNYCGQDSSSLLNIDKIS